MIYHQFAATAAKLTLRLSLLALLAVVIFTVPLLHSQLTYPPRYPLPSENFFYEQGFVYGRCATSTHDRANRNADQLQIDRNEELETAPSKARDIVRESNESDEYETLFESIVGDAAKYLVALYFVRSDIYNDYNERFRKLDLALNHMLISCAQAQIDAHTFYSGPGSSSSYILAHATARSPLNIRWLAYPQRRGVRGD